LYHYQDLIPALPAFKRMISINKMLDVKICFTKKKVQWNQTN
jgi:hypothetical protein